MEEHPLALMKENTSREYLPAQKGRGPRSLSTFSLASDSPSTDSGQGDMETSRTNGEYMAT
jgi:hypothetical protein